MANDNASQSRRKPDHRIPLTTIDRIVTENLGPARVRSKAQPEALFRQIAMYLAKHVGGWSTTRIGKFYNGRDHSTVCHAIARIQ
jgi:chromosomal replication initiation ATPase DnaA